MQVSPPRGVVKPKLKVFEGLKFKVRPTFDLKQSHLLGVFVRAKWPLGVDPLFSEAQKECLFMELLAEVPGVARDCF